MNWTCLRKGHDWRKVNFGQPDICARCDLIRRVKYRNKVAFTYHSPRYNKDLTVPFDYPSDGATFAEDIESQGWWVHDLMCDTGKWDDGTPVTNWQASMVLGDILRAEGRWWRGTIRWPLGTFLFGGGECRKNGMFKLRPTVCGNDRQEEAL